MSQTDVAGMAVEVPPATGTAPGDPAHPVTGAPGKGDGPRHLSKRRRRPLAGDAALVLLVWAAGASVFFRQQLGSGFGKIMGNDGDARLVVYINEHWFGVLHGRASWLDPQFFHPVKGLLGWSDTFLLYQVFYTPLREIGFDPFLAMQTTLVLLSLVGFASFVCLSRVAFGAPRVVALAGALVFTFANDLFLHSGSFQFSGIYFVPLVLLLAVLAWRRRSDRPGRSAALGVGCGLLAALLFYSTYYVAWFTALAAGLALVALLIAGRVRRVVRAAGESARALLGAAAGFGVGIIPFLVTYLPARSHHLTYAQTIGYAGRLRDVVNVGGGNLIWSRVLHHFDPAMTTASEVSYAVTPILLFLVVFGGALGCWLLAKGRAQRPANAWTAAVLAVTVLVLCVLPLRTRFGTPWAIVWHIPGASPIRAIGRLELVANLVASLVLVVAATELAARLRTAKRSTLLRAAGIGVLAIAVLEQVNTTSVSQVDRQQQMAMLRSAHAPAFTCRSFYVTDASQPSMAFFEYQIDAMLISQKLGIPTLNGYTAYNPTGWNLEYPGDPAYPLYVQSWVAAKGAQDGVCGLDLGTMRWTQGLPASVAPPAG